MGGDLSHPGETLLKPRALLSFDRSRMDPATLQQLSAQPV